MNNKRPYTHILKNLFHEQATEIIPLLLPEYQVEQVLNIELPELKSTYIEGSPGKFEEGLVELALPGATLLGVYQTEWIEHSGNFERAYRSIAQRLISQYICLLNSRQNAKTKCSLIA